MVREAAYEDMHRGQNKSKNFIVFKLEMGKKRNIETVIQWYLDRKISNNAVFGNKVQLVIENHYLEHVLKKKLSFSELKRISIEPIVTDEGLSFLTFQDLKFITDTFEYHDKTKVIGRWK